MPEISPASHSFGRDRRLLTPGDFRRVQTSGRSLDLGPLVFRVARRDRAQPSRLGLAVSRRAGNAVARNRIKRLVREAFRLRPSGLPGLDVVVTARPAAAAFAYEDVARLFDELERRLSPGRS